MKFYGNAIVWDKERNKALCTFKDGEFETKEDRVKDILLDLGYKHDGEIIEDVEYEVTEEVVEDIKNYEEMTNKELKAILEAKGYMNLDRKTKKQLLTMLEGD